MGNLLASRFSRCRVLRIWHSTRYSMVLTMAISLSTACRSFSMRAGSQRASMTSQSASRAMGSMGAAPLPGETVGQAA